MALINKKYENSFVLEPTKLTSIVDKIRERLSDHPAANINDRFEVFLSGKRVDEIHTLESLFALENSKNRRIERLLITCSAKSEMALRPEHEIVVDFGAPKTPSNSKIVEVTIFSDDAGWASRALSDIEEQLERTWVQNAPFIILLAAIAIVVTLFFASNFVRLNSSLVSYDKSMWLTDANLERVGEIVDKHRPITDEEMREIYTMQLNNVLQDRRPTPIAPGARSRTLIFLGIPFIIILTCIGLLIFTYKHHVFKWGDEVDRYESRMRRRKFVWGIIIALLVVGVATNLLSLEVVRWIPTE